MVKILNAFLVFVLVFFVFVSNAHSQGFGKNKAVKTSDLSSLMTRVKNQNLNQNLSQKDLKVLLQAFQKSNPNLLKSSDKEIDTMLKILETRDADIKSFLSSSSEL